MINRVQALNYRCLHFVDRTISPFQVLIGPNASGKSAFLDCISFLADLVREKEGVVAAVGQRAPDVRDLCWLRRGDVFELAVEAMIPDQLHRAVAGGAYTTVRYWVRVGLMKRTRELGLLAEKLWLTRDQGGWNSPILPRSLFPAPKPPPDCLVSANSTKRPKGWRTVIEKLPDGSADWFRAETTHHKTLYHLGLQRSALAELPEDETRFPVAIWFRRLLTDGVRRLALNSDSLRRPCPPGRPRAFLPDGSNLPWIVADLLPDRLREWVSHVALALPDLVDITTVERPEDRHRYVVLKFGGKLELPAWVVSDGTLRLLALTLPAYVPKLEGVFLIEEPENGIHPRAVELVLQSLSSVYDAQVLMATHSPVILSLAKPEQVLCFARTSRGETDVVSGLEHPRLHSWRRETDLGTLFASGMLE